MFYADKIGATKQTALDLLYAEGVDSLVLAAASYMQERGMGHWFFVRVETMPDNGEKGVLWALEESTCTVRESQARA